MQKLVINKFGPISNCELNINDFMILIGEQATGKSIICKSIYFFKSIRDDLKSFAYNMISNGPDEKNITYKIVEDSLKTKFDRLFGIRDLDEDLLIRYFYADNVFVEVRPCENAVDTIDIRFCDRIKEFIKVIEQKSHRYYESLNSIDNIDSTYYHLEKNKLYLILTKEINSFFKDDREIFYIPAGRGLLSLMTNQLLNIDLDSVDYATGEFLKLIQKQRNIFNPMLRKALVNSAYNVGGKFIAQDESVKRILKGEYYFSDNKEFLRVERDSSLQINYTSSGQQEILWILNLLNLWIEQKSNIFVVIEEPEAHLFPKAQKEVMEYIAHFFNSNNNQIIIATHSPYILTSANNLLYAGRIGKQSHEKVNKIIPSEKWIDLNRFDAYMIGDNKEQYIRTIIDDELKEIAAEEIDKISEEIRKTYSDIFNVEVEDE